jgi:REP element-mobilizing transposase RayT
MAQSLSQMYIHLVFGTKYRYPYIRENIENQLHPYISGILNNHDSPAIIINSVPDHIHILFVLSKTQALSNVVQEVKQSSSKWMKGQGVPNFNWQRGYGAFSVSHYKVDTVTRYIARQKEHHKIKTLQEEIETMMKIAGLLDFDMKYFWD